MMKARIRHLHKSAKDWEAFQELYKSQNNKDFVPLAGELIIYDSDSLEASCTKIKIGDGVTSLQELPFIIDSTVANYLQEHFYAAEIDGGRV